MHRNISQTIPDEVSPTLGKNLEKRMEQVFVDEMTRDHFRTKIQQIIDERVETVPFKKKIQEYSSEEIDKKIFNNLRYYFSVIGIPFIVSGLVFLIEHLLQWK